MNEKEEILDKIDENDNVIGSITRHDVIENNLLHRAALVFILDSEGRIFVHKRPETKKVFPGFWAIGCGGGVQKNESYEDAAKREMKEEMGIETPLYFVTKLRFKDEHVNYIAHLFCGTYSGELNPDPEEVEEWKFMSKVELSNEIGKEKFLADDKRLINDIEKIKEIIKKNAN